MVREKAFSFQFDNIDSAGPFPSYSSILIFALIIGVFIGARLWGLTASCLWFDEVFSVHAARHEWSRLLHFVAADIIHPPLFYILLKVWINIGGESLFWLRLFPVLTSLGVIIPFWMFCRELQLGSTELRLSLLLMAVNGYMIKYAQEVRMYSLLLFLTVCSLWLFIRFFNATQARKQLLALSALNLLLVYTHYYGWLVIAAEAAFLVLWDRAKIPDFLIAAAMLLLCFSPWIYAVTLAGEQGNGLAQNIGWVARPRLADVVQFFALLNAPFYFRQSSNQVVYVRWALLASFVIFGLPLGAFSWRLIRQRHQQREWSLSAPKCLILFFVLPLALALLASWVLPHSIWGTRHLIIVTVPYLLLAAVALNRLRPQWLRIFVLITLSCWLFLAGTGLLLRRGDTYIWCAWGQLSQQIIQRQLVPAKIINVYTFEELVAYHLWFASEESAGGKLKVGLIKGVPGLQEDPAYFLPRAFSDIRALELSALNERHFWIAFRDTKFSEHGPPLRTLKDRGYEILEVLEVEAGGQRAFLVELEHQ
ncbi:MAG: glycosyltransferase family 39 protein [Pyrinomonadaceae bacterium]|nr:glycosyltransferase family 39 protein [Pyrinomonadaceae bacterium]